MAGLSERRPAWRVIAHVGPLFAVYAGLTFRVKEYVTIQKLYIYSIPTHTIDIL